MADGGSSFAQRARIHPHLAAVREQLPGHWTLHQVTSLSSARQAERQFHVSVIFRSGERREEITLPVELFPWLIVGSNWRDGLLHNEDSDVRRWTLTGGPARRATLLWDKSRLGWIPSAMARDPSGDAMAAFVMHTKAGNEIWLPQSELLRAFYFGIPKATVCHLSGLNVHHRMSSAAYELWRPKHTGWLDFAGGTACIQRSKNLSEREATQIAKLILHPAGKLELERLWNWVMENLKTSDARPGLPSLRIPFDLEGSIWRAESCELPRLPGSGVERALVTRLKGFVSTEPYTALVQGADNDNRTAPPADSLKKGWPGRNRSEPSPPMSASGDPPDSSLAGFEIPGISVDDISARNRTVIKREKSHIVTEKAGGRPDGVSVTSDVGMGGRGKSATGAAPGELVPDDAVEAEADPIASPKQVERLTLILDAIQRMSASGYSARWVPAPTNAYVFRTPANNTAYAESRAKCRRLLILEVKRGERIVYVMDPEFRAISDAFSIGVFWSPKGVMQYVDFGRIADHFENTRRRGTSWLDHQTLPEPFIAMTIRRRTISTEESISKFTDEAIQRILMLLER